MAWKSSVETIHNCPIVNTTRGLILMDPYIIRALAGAVLDQSEWLAVLLGESKQNGLLIEVDGLYVPPHQTRTVATCDIDEKKFPFPDNVKKSMVGVIHSHHDMSARFSGVDLGLRGLCHRYPVSIVIAYSNLSGESALLGFDYEAVGRIPLPCGAYGKAQFNIAPLGVEEWPIKDRTEPIMGTSHSVKHLGDCKRYSEGPDSTKYSYRRVGKCGSEEENLYFRSYVFGANGREILEVLPKPKKEYKYSAKGSLRGYWDKEDEDSLINPYI